MDIEEKLCFDYIKKSLERIEGMLMKLTIDFNLKEYVPECNCYNHESGKSTGGWYCPVHGQCL